MGWDFRIGHHASIADCLGLTRNTVNKRLLKLVKAGIFEQRASKKPVKMRGHLMEYRFRWDVICALVGRYPSCDYPARALSQEYEPTRIALPNTLFRSGTWNGQGLTLELQSGSIFHLPGDERELLRHLIEPHWNQRLPEESLDYLLSAAGQLKPRTLSVFSQYLSRAKCPSTVNYYTSLMKKAKLTGAQPPSASDKPRADDEVLVVEFAPSVAAGVQQDMLGW